jgi:hypothetical protein
MKILMDTTSVNQQGIVNPRSYHPASRLNQSGILPKRTMRDKRFADRIAPIRSWFRKKSELKPEFTGKSKE